VRSNYAYCLMCSFHSDVKVMAEWKYDCLPEVMLGDTEDMEERFYCCNNCQLLIRTRQLELNLSRFHSLFKSGWTDRNSEREKLGTRSPWGALFGGRERFSYAYLFQIVTQGKVNVNDFFVAQKWYGGMRLEKSTVMEEVFQPCRRERSILPIADRIGAI
jgi:hypothetical protein